MNTPEIGSVWKISGEVVETVIEVRKRGRGYQVVTDNQSGLPKATYRLRDFTKAAKPL